MALNDPLPKTRMTLEFATRQVRALAAELARLEARQTHTEAVALARHGCERVQCIKAGLEGGQLEPEQALQEALAVFESLSRLRAQVATTA